MADRLPDSVQTAHTENIQNFKVPDVQQIQTDWDSGAHSHSQPDLVPAASDRGDSPRQNGGGKYSVLGHQNFYRVILPVYRCYGNFCVDLISLFCNPFQIAKYWISRNYILYYFL